MSSLVQAKCTNSSAGRSSASSAKRSLMKYSTALTSWLVVRSIALTRAASVGENASASARRRAVAARGKGRQFDHAGLASQRQQPFDLDLHARPDQPELREDRSQRLDLAGVTAVERGEGKQLGVGHGG